MGGEGCLGNDAKKTELGARSLQDELGCGRPAWLLGAVRVRFAERGAGALLPGEGLVRESVAQSSLGEMVHAISHRSRVESHGRDGEHGSVEGVGGSVKGGRLQGRVDGEREAEA